MRFRKRIAISPLTRLLMTLFVPLTLDSSLVFTFAAPHCGHLDSREIASAQDDSGSFIPNFQDLSAVLSLLAADSVERRLVRSDSTQMWERCSSLWSIFGLVGLARVQLKIAAGLASSERAGVELKGAGGFTVKKTEESSSAWGIGSTAPGLWLDIKEQLLGHAKASGSRWKKPFVIACAYSQCPPRGRRFRREVAEHFLLTILTLALAMGPLLILRKGDIALNDVAISLMLAGGFVGGCLLPFLLIYFNDVGVGHIASLSPKLEKFSDSVAIQEELPYQAPVLDKPSRRHTRNSSMFTSVSTSGSLAISKFASGLHASPHQSDTSSRTFDRLFNVGDMVVSSADRHLVLWRQSTSAIFRSADYVLVRIAAGTSFIAILAAYIVNYILLGSVPVSATYIWIGVQVFILCVRYWAWAVSGQRQFMRTRHRGLLYIVTSKLVHEAVPSLRPDSMPFTVAAESVASEIGSEKAPDIPIMDEDFIKFCVAAACSKLSNIGVSTLSNNLPALSRLAGSAPRDILIAPVFSLRHIPDSERDQFALLRLPWATMEEFYLAQGLVLGQNPLSYAGLFMAAILRNGTFVGVTTVHPSRNPLSPRCHGLTMDGCEVLDSLVDAKLGVFAGVDDNMTQYHESFRENIKQCRTSSELNGPPHVELHAVYEGQYFEYQQVLPTVDAALQKAKRIAEEAAAKTDHSDCIHSQCYFYGLIGRTF